MLVELAREVYCPILLQVVTCLVKEFDVSGPRAQPKKLERLAWRAEKVLRATFSRSTIVAPVPAMLMTIVDRAQLAITLKYYSCEHQIDAAHPHQVEDVAFTKRRAWLVF